MVHAACLGVVAVNRVVGNVVVRQVFSDYKAGTSYPKYIRDPAQVRPSSDFTVHRLHPPVGRVIGAIVLAIHPILTKPATNCFSPHQGDCVEVLYFIDVCIDFCLPFDVLLMDICETT